MENEKLYVNKSGDIPELLVYGNIGFDGITDSEFARALMQLEHDYPLINIRINSPGGDVWQGLAMHNALTRCKAETHCYIDGLAASIATVISLGCDKIFMNKYARFMTHKAKGGSFGTADDLNTTAEMIKSTERVIATIYSGRCGLSVDDSCNKYLTGKDRWLTAEEALKEKLVDELFDGESIKAPKNASAYMELYNQYDKVLTNKIEIFKTDIMKKIQLSLTPELMGLLGLSNDANDTAFINAINTAIEKAKTVDTLQSQLSQEKAAKAEAIKNFTELKNQAVTEKVKSLLENALENKKITKELSDSFETDYATNPEGLEKVLNGMSAYKSVADKLDNADPAAIDKKFQGKTYMQLHSEDLLPELKAKHPAVYEDMKKEWKERKETGKL